MKLATTIGDFGQYESVTKQEAIGYIREAGFHYMDYSFTGDYRQNKGAYGDNWKEYLEDIKEHAKTLSVQFVQAHAPMGKPFAAGEEYIAFVEATKRSIEGCHILGIDNIVVHSGHSSGLINKDDSMERNRAFYHDLLPFAEKFGVNILTENFNYVQDGRYLITSPHDMVELIELVDHPLFHACWDTGHGNMFETPQDEAIRILGDHLYGLHVQDNICNLDLHVPPFCGSLSVDSLMHGLLDINYTGYFTFEACYTFLPENRRKKYGQDDRLLVAPLPLKIKAESLLYEIGKTILSAYDCYEE